ATVTFTVNEPPVNTAPVANDDSFTLDTGTTFSIKAPGILSNDSDADGDALTVTLVDDVSNGTLLLDPSGFLAYIPDEDFSGTDSFTYVANDGTEDSAVTTVTFTVNAPPPISTFNIDIVFTDDSFTESQQALFTSAANRWEEIIIEDIPDVFVNDELGVVDDIVIEASAPEIDGVSGILGQAGPTLIRSDSFLPVTGVMSFDVADVDNLEENGQLENVILHEMGHVLGIGTLWGDGLFDLLTDAGSDDPRFTGEQTTTAYNDIFGVTEESVPLANTGSPGTRDSHWRESVFGNELMTGFLDSDSVNPISEVTIASLADIGYTVDFEAADLYIPPASSIGASNSVGSTANSVGSTANVGVSNLVADGHDHFGHDHDHDHLNVLIPEVAFI
ncbi:MAG: Ig-like domain-containing protein, partial [Cyanobacteria bacterium P01_D01_bin.156]